MPISKDVFDTYFSCFSEHPVEYKGTRYKTAEHAYHSQRYENSNILSEIREALTAHDAWSISQKYKDQQFPDFSEQKRSVMKEILEEKYRQNKDVEEALRMTGEEEIIKYEPKDPYWGTGPDGNGRNELGKLWMEIRSMLTSS